uniref:Uncharacterized protein n=1 Tax=Romanomermis culicivorax TaxID=13658 RepID=A0A915KP47_ROMCU
IPVYYYLCDFFLPLCKQHLKYPDYSDIRRCKKHGYPDMKIFPAHITSRHTREFYNLKNFQTSNLFVNSHEFGRKDMSGREEISENYTSTNLPN